MITWKPWAEKEVGSIADVVENEKTGLLVRAKDAGALTVALGRLVGDMALSDRLAKQGRASVFQNCSIRQGIQGFERLYQNLC